MEENVTAIGPPRAQVFTPLPVRASPAVDQGRSPSPARVDSERSSAPVCTDAGPSTPSMQARPRAPAKPPSTAAQLGTAQAASRHRPGRKWVGSRPRCRLWPWNLWKFTTYYGILLIVVKESNWDVYVCAHFVQKTWTGKKYCMDYFLKKYCMEYFLVPIVMCVCNYEIKVWNSHWLFLKKQTKKQIFCLFNKPVN